ncbi:MAG: PRC-barrel domain protein [Firmicutes bacterium ADurb.Bin373]|nr:YlmC/YmxH family sporulation protein [Bacillota bacterium]OQA10127.1 MAG: PRC-barrel domain protein [Firmicutes bacterium ADurb.Bin373]
MRMGELVGKEIININNGRRLGVVGDSDITVDIESGDIQSIILPRKNNLISLWVDRQHLIIPWNAVKKIGTEVIIVELDQTSPLYQRYQM